jgi:GrpB-like predicted nucleotidyltransferase (UPF0157 family)
MGKYIFKPYDPKFKGLFNKEKSKLKKILQKNTEIKHVGSTAVPGLGGKGIIDIAIKTPRKKLSQFKKKLGGLGYECRLSEHPENDKRIFLQKIIKYSRKERRIHIHLVLDNEFWESFIVVRDYLRNNDKECKKYSKIKKEAVKYAKGEGKKYREYKDRYLENLLRAAIENRQKK